VKDARTPSAQYEMESIARTKKKRPGTPTRPFTP
jgi:hypothetical protein